jgi:hypothetical protein
MALVFQSLPSQGVKPLDFPMGRYYALEVKDDGCPEVPDHLT